MSKINPEDTTNRPIEYLLRSIQPEPGKRYYQKMANAPWMETQTSRQPAWGKTYRFAALAAGILVLAAALLATPAGNVVANEILQFFTRAQGNVLPVPTDQYVLPIPSPTPAPTRALALLPAEQVAKTTPTPQPTATAYPGMPAELSLVEAEAIAGFDLYEPLRLPRDYRLKRITYNTYHQAIEMEYTSPRAATGEFSRLLRGRISFPLQLVPMPKSRLSLLVNIPLSLYAVFGSQMPGPPKGPGATDLNGTPFAGRPRM